MARMDEPAPPSRRQLQRGQTDSDPADTADEIDRLIEVVRALHEFTPARSSVSIDRFERRSGLQLPPDMRRFYSEFDGARLFVAEYVLFDPDGFLPLEVPIRAATGRRAGLADSWTSFGRSRTGYSIGINLLAPPLGSYRVSAWHGSMNDPHARLRPIATGFTQFLARALRSTHHPYWTEH